MQTSINIVFRLADSYRYKVVHNLFIFEVVYLIYNVYVTRISFANLLFMFIAFILIENYTYPLESFVISKIIYVFKKASRGST